MKVFLALWTIALMIGTTSVTAAENETPTISTAKNISQSSDKKEESSQPRSTFLRLTVKEYETRTKPKLQKTSSSDLTYTPRTCTNVCLAYNEHCVPGCNPPNEKGTITGCSSCYSKELVCTRWGLECIPPY